MNHIDYFINLLWMLGLVLIFKYHILPVFQGRKKPPLNRYKLIGLYTQLLIYYGCHPELGLCLTTLAMERRGLLTVEELRFLELDMRVHNPRGTGLGYWWPAGEKEPRIKFIKDRLKQLKTTTHE